MNRLSILRATARTQIASAAEKRVYRVTWSNHPAWRARHRFDCLGRLEPREVEVLECFQTFGDAGEFEQLALFDDGDYFLTKGRYRIDETNPLDYWIMHETAETLLLDPFGTGLGEQRLKYISITDRMRTTTTKRQSPDGRLTLWERFE